MSEIDTLKIDDVSYSIKDTTSIRCNPCRIKHKKHFHKLNPEMPDD